MARQFSTSTKGAPRGPGLIAVVVIMTVLAVFSVSVRLFRCVKTRRFGFEDALIVAALILSFALSGVMGYCLHLGYGEHIITLAHDLTNVIQMLRVIYFGPAIVLWASMLAKLALGTTLLRLGFGRTFQILVGIIMGVSVVFNLWPSIDSLVGCNSWTELSRLTHSDHCVDTKQAGLVALLYVSGAANTLIDLLYVILIEIFLRRVKLSSRDRFAFRMVLVFMLTATICCGVRLALYKDHVDSRDPTWTSVYVADLGVADVNLSLCAACLPAIRQVFGRYFPAHVLFWRSTRGGGTTYGAGGGVSDGGRGTGVGHSSVGKWFSSRLANSRLGTSISHGGTRSARGTSFDTSSKSTNPKATTKMMTTIASNNVSIKTNNNNNNNNNMHGLKSGLCDETRINKVETVRVEVEMGRIGGDGDCREPPDECSGGHEHGFEAYGDDEHGREGESGRDRDRGVGFGYGYGHGHGHGHGPTSRSGSMSGSRSGSISGVSKYGSDDGKTPLGLICEISSTTP